MAVQVQAIKPRFFVTSRRICCGLTAVCLAAIGLSCAPPPPAPAADLFPSTPRMESRSEVVGYGLFVVAVDPAVGGGTADLESALRVARDSGDLISEWDESSDISAINRAAGQQPVAVRPATFGLIEESLRLGNLTEGAFDITFASCGDLFSVRERRRPSAAQLDACLPLVNYRRVRLDPALSAVLLPHGDMRVGLGGLRKGYRVDASFEELRRRGHSDAIVESGGDLRVRLSSSREPLTVEIAHPRITGAIWGSIALREGAVATSGDYEWFYEDENGVRQHHIIDPREGLPAARSVSATVIADTATRADALATALFVLGPERGIALAERLPGTEAMIINPDLVWSATSGFPWAEGGKPTSLHTQNARTESTALARKL